MFSQKIFTFEAWQQKVYLLVDSLNKQDKNYVQL